MARLGIHGICAVRDPCQGDPLVPRAGVSGRPPAVVLGRGGGRPPLHATSDTARASLWSRRAASRWGVALGRRRSRRGRWIRLCQCWHSHHSTVAKTAFVTQSMKFGALPSTAARNERHGSSTRASHTRRPAHIDTNVRKRVAHSQSRSHSVGAAKAAAHAPPRAGGVMTAFRLHTDSLGGVLTEDVFIVKVEPYSLLPYSCTCPR